MVDYPLGGYHLWQSLFENLNISNLIGSAKLKDELEQGHKNSSGAFPQGLGYTLFVTESVHTSTKCKRSIHQIKIAGRMIQCASLCLKELVPVKMTLGCSRKRDEDCLEEKT